MATASSVYYFLSNFSFPFLSQCKICFAELFLKSICRISRAILTGTRWLHKSCLKASWPDTSVSFLRTGVLYLVWESSCTGRLVRVTKHTLLRLPLWYWFEFCYKSVWILETQSKTMWNFTFSESSLPRSSLLSPVRVLSLSFIVFRILNNILFARSLISYTTCRATCGEWRWLWK